VTSSRSIPWSPLSLFFPLRSCKVMMMIDSSFLRRWDLKMGQRGSLDRLPVAHAGSITSLDWCNRLSFNVAGSIHSHLHPPLAIPNSAFGSHHNAGSGANSADHGGSQSDYHDSTPNNSLGWLVSGGLDRTVKIWDLTSASPVNSLYNSSSALTSSITITAAPNSTRDSHAHTRDSHGSGEASGRMRTRPAYVLHPSFPVRKVKWRPAGTGGEWGCELAVVSNIEFGSGSGGLDMGGVNHPMQLSANNTTGPVTHIGGRSSKIAPGVVGGGAFGSIATASPTRPTYAHAAADGNNRSQPPALGSPSGSSTWAASTGGDAVEIWDVRRGWIAKWSVTGSAAEGSVTGKITFPY
jgi:WD repeat-containing protein 24